MDIETIKKIDRYIGFFLVILLGFITKPFSIFCKIERPKDILAIQFWGIGETILTLPALQALKKKFPKAKLTILATDRVKAVYEDFKHKDKLIILEMSPAQIIKYMFLNFKRYDIVIDMEEYLNISALIALFVGKRRLGFKGLRSIIYTDSVRYDDDQHVVQTFLDLVRLLGINYDTEKLIGLPFSKQDKEAVARFMHKHGIKKEDFIVGITPGAAESGRQRLWPEERFAALADELVRKHNAKVIFTGSKGETDLVDRIISKTKKNGIISSAGAFNLRQFFALVKECKVFISNDTGPMHIAAAQGVKTIGLFGPNLPERFGPYGPGNIGLYNKIECSPCINVHEGIISECKYKGNLYQKCMKLIKVSDVMDAVLKMIDRGV